MEEKKTKQKIGKKGKKKFSKKNFKEVIKWLKI